MKKHLVTFAVALFAAALGIAIYAHFTGRSKIGSSIASPETPAPVKKAEFSQFPEYVLHAGKLDSDGDPTTNARLCTKQKSQCYAALADAKEIKDQFFFALTPSAERVPVSAGGSLILFSGTFSGGGSGTLDSLALLEYDRNEKIVNLLPRIRITEQGERKAWDLPSVSVMPVIAVADAKWDVDAGESHFGSHYFEVEIYLFDEAKFGYVKRTDYTTSKKYPGADDGPPAHVLQAERTTILGKLAEKKS